MPSIVGVVPARWDSRRWPGKALALVNGRPLIEWAYDSLIRAEYIERAFIATDHSRIREWAVTHGIPCIMTSAECRNGTERVSEAARSVPADFYINVQADQVGLEPETIDTLVNTIVTNGEIPMATVATTVECEGDRLDRDTVFVATDEFDVATAFVRGGDSILGVGEWLRHVGIYAYRYHALRKYTAMEPTSGERSNSLEQLRSLEAGWKIGVVRTASRALSYDRPRGASTR